MQIELNEQQVEVLLEILRRQKYEGVSNSTIAICEQIISKLEAND